MRRTTQPYRPFAFAMVKHWSKSPLEKKNRQPAVSKPSNVTAKVTNQFQELET